MRPSTLGSLAFWLVACLPAQETPRTPWDLLRAEHDADKDGRITATEYTRGLERFARLDKDRDGAITAADFQGGGRGGRGRRGDPHRMANALLNRMLKLGPDQKLDRKGFDAWARKLDADANGSFDEDELGEGLPRSMRRRVVGAFDGDDDGVVTLKELGRHFERLDADKDGTISARDLGGGRRSGRGGRGAAAGAPKVGSVAPDFTLPYKTGRATATLSSFKGKKPVALIFGSYT